MKQLLLFNFALATAASLSAQSPAPEQNFTIMEAGTLKATYARTTAGHNSQRAVKGKATPSNVINPSITLSAAQESLPAGVKFLESFEGWDGITGNWAPEGWTIESKGSSQLTSTQKWGVDKADPRLPSLPDGSCAAMISYASTEQDEWLISPTVTIGANERIEFYLYANHGYVFDNSKIDWTNDIFLEHIICHDVELHVQPEGENEWTPIWKFSDEFINLRPNEFYDITLAFRRFAVNLSAYEGRNIKFAFRYVGTDGDTAILDLVTIALEPFDNIAYMPPQETFFSGFGRMEGWDAMPLSVAYYPTNTPISWTNCAFHDDPYISDLYQREDASYCWWYSDPETGEWTSDNSDPANLTLTYRPDYSTEKRARNNWIKPPVLSASSPQTSDGQYTADHERIQIGGAPEFLIQTDADSDPEWTEMSLLPYDLNNEGFTYIIEDSPEIGDFAIPVFGYNVNTDKYWLNYTFNGEEPSEDDDARLIAIMNYMHTPAPMVINGLHVLGLGEVPASKTIEFKIELIPLQPGGVFDSGTTPLASATCTADKIIRADYGVNQFLTIPFDFETPFVTDPDSQPFMIRFSGFHNPEIRYFAPLQSAIPRPDMFCLGWIEKEIKHDSDTYRSTYSPIARIEGDYGPCINAFTMNIKGHYPWLEAETDEITLPANGAPVTVKLGSFYDGAQLEFSQIAGLEATATGRFGDCRLTLSRNDATVIPSGTLTIKAPGVETSIRINSENGAIAGINADSGTAVPVAAFTPDGRRVSLDNTGTGIVISRYSDGSIRKTCVK